MKDRSKIIHSVFHCLLLLSLIAKICSGQEINTSMDVDSSALKDSQRYSIWQPKLFYKWNGFDPYINVSTYQFELEAPVKETLPRYYDPKNIIPKKYWELDYRYSSYYTPREVSDFMDHVMQRPRSDTFFSVPTIALLAASLALQYIDIQKKIEIKATDYLVDEKYLPLLFSLWEKSPQTATELFESGEIQADRTVIILQSELEELANRKLVKVKRMEKAPATYFPAQSKETVILLLKDADTRENLTIKQTESINNLIQKIKAF